jgi:hypothetical protein
MIATAVGVLNVVLGLVYTQYGTMTAIEMRRHWRRFGFSHFGAAWIAMAFTCGPHHLVHGVHILFEGRAGGPLDLAAVLIGFPAGVTWFLLRVEAFRGGRGDRFVSGTPWWINGIPALAGVYLGALAVFVGHLNGFSLARLPLAMPNLLLIGSYMMIGWYLVRTQLENRRPLGGWSVSGLALAVIFPTCALMHGIHAAYTLAGVYTFDIHGVVTDWLAVPASVYFVWVVQALYRGTFRDWNGVNDVAVPTSPAEPAIAPPAAA